VETEIVLGIPGPWIDHKEFVQTVVSETEGEYIFAGLVLLHVSDKEHVSAEVNERFPAIRQSFEFSGQGRFTEAELDQIDSHCSIVYLHFPFNVLGERVKIQKFTRLIQKLGGFAVNIESTGLSYTWDEWNARIASDDSMTLYNTFVIPLYDDDHYYTVGMYNFGLPDCQVTSSFTMEEATNTLNQFNIFLLLEEPKMASGHTFSLDEESSRYRLELIKDHRYTPDELFQNPNGLWDLVLL
jgi:hypothetical protein